MSGTLLRLPPGPPLLRRRPCLPATHRPAARKGGGVGEGGVGEVQQVLHQQAMLHRHLHLNLCVPQGGWDWGQHVGLWQGAGKEEGYGRSHGCGALLAMPRKTEQGAQSPD